MVRATNAARTFVTRDQAAAEAARLAQAPATIPAIGIHLWPTAPGLETVACNDEERWRWIFGKTVSLALRRLLGRLELGPQLVEIAEHGAEVDVLAEHPLAPDAGFLPWATFFYGATYDAVAEAHQELIEHNWRPRAPQPAQ